MTSFDSSLARVRSPAPLGVEVFSERLAAMPPKEVAQRAGETIRDLRIAEVVEQDLQIEGGSITAYRVKMKLSFKYEDG